MPLVDVRDEIVAWGKWGVANRAHFSYSEGAERMEGIHKRGLLPISCDCSAFVTLCYAWAYAPDPNGLNYDGQGYTGTLLSHDEHIALFKENAQHVQVPEVLPGDLVVYGGGTGEHVALVVGVWNADILTVSMGENGDPNYVWSHAPTVQQQDGHAIDTREPRTFLRCNTMGNVPVPPVAPAPHSTVPSAAYLSACKLVNVPSVNVMKVALANGWSLYYYGVDQKFHTFHSQMPPIITPYVDVNYQHRKI